ncbi:DUF188 domain-containing protein [Fictibacillus iocasae]|uniref:UPF0178 protein ACFQPF_12775 n=1 Tax=Fictibacillus iocasae TaxID=2715437 RepID=A0ABW2NS36_9BACL
MKIHAELNIMTKIIPKRMLIDADACPVSVKKAVLEISSHHPIESIFVASIAHSGSERLGGNWIFVDAVKEEADMYIINHSSRGDIVITQDYGLASLLLPKGVHVVSPRGKRYTEFNIDTLLQDRYLSAKARKAGGRTKGPARFTEEDLQRFILSLKKILSNEQGIGS